MKPSFHRHLILAATICAAPVVFAQQQDAPPIDAAQLLTALKALRTQQAAQVQANRAKILRDVQAAGASGASAAAAWEEAVRQVQFNGAAHESAQFREWKDKEGEALKESEVQNAAKLYFQWVALTLQRAGGVPVKDLLPQVIQYTKDLAADQLTIEALDDRLKKESDPTAAASKRANAREKRKDDQATKRMHDQILNRNVASGAPVQALKAAEFMNVPKWEHSAGNVDGIFQNVILPELRAQKDPRLLEYWDMKLKREAEAAAKSKLSFDADKFAQVRKPELLWNRAQDLAVLGQKNRAIGEMFNILKTYPTHPAAGDWMTKLEATLTGGDPAASASGATGAAAAPQ